MRLCDCQDDEAGNVLSSLMGVVSPMCCCSTSLFLGSAAACCLFLLLLSNPATLALPCCPAATLHNLLLFMACWASLHSALRTYLQYLQFALLTSDHISHWDNFTTTTRDTIAPWSCSWFHDTRHNTAVVSLFSIHSRKCSVARQESCSA